MKAWSRLEKRSLLNIFPVKYSANTIYNVPEENVPIEYVPIKLSLACIKILSSYDLIDLIHLQNEVNTCSLHIIRLLYF